MRTHFPHFVDYSIEGGKPKISLYFQDQTRASTSLQDNIIIQTMIFFSLMDSHIDNKMPQLEGLSFFKKYKALPKSNDEEIMFKEVYRIMKFLRNSSIHVMSKINEGATDVSISYTHNGTNFIMICSKDILEWILTFILLYFDDTSLNKNYKLGLLRSYYRGILSCINNFNDEFNPGQFLTISSGMSLITKRRYRIKGANHQITNTSLVIERFKYEPEEVGYAAADYYIDYNNEAYIIPDEALDNSGVISLPEIIQWKIS